MEAERLIAMEAALRDLSVLYPAARRFTDLRRAADDDLLPRLESLGAALRKYLRHGHLDEAAADKAAMEILALATHWRGRIDAVRRSAAYRDALAAVAADRQADLADAIPRVLDGFRIERPTPPHLCFPVSTRAQDGRTGARPFAGVDECIARIAAVAIDGFGLDPARGDWWEVELSGVRCAATPTELESPFCLRIDPSSAGLAVFADDDEPGLQVFTPRLHGPMTAVLAAESQDAWWDAYDGSYVEFRDAVRRGLEARRIPVCLEAISAGPAPGQN